MVKNKLKKYNYIFYKMEFRVRRYNKEDRDESNRIYQMTDEEKNELIEKLLKVNFIDRMFHRGYIPKIYNGSYGGKDISLTGEVLIVLIYKRFNNNEKFNIFGVNSDKFLLNFIKAKVINYLGPEKISTKTSLSVFNFVLIDYYNSIIINDYDGKENLEFDSDIYFRMEVERIINSDESDKIAKISELLKYNYRDDIIIDEDDVVKDNIYEEDQILKIEK
jgi:hypothetical protein